MGKDNTMLNAIDEQMSRCNAVLREKFKDYGGHEDPFWHFERAAELLQLTREQVLMTLFSKHLTCIVEMAEDPDTYTDERWHEKLTDAINYLLILSAMVEDARRADTEYTDMLSPQQVIERIARGEK